MPSPEYLRIKISEESNARKTSNHNAKRNAMFVKKTSNTTQKNGGNKKAERNGSKKNRNATIKCFKCGEIGHRSKNCPKKQNAKPINKPTDLSLYCKPEEVADAKQAQTKLGDNSNWCLVSGCTSHMCKNRNTFTELNGEDVGKLYLAYNSCTTIKGRGPERAYLKSDEEIRAVTFEKTLYVPDLQRNLASVSKITDQGHSVTFFKTHA